MRKFLPILFLIVCSKEVFAWQARVSSPIEFNSLYFLREWSARSEAMGRAGVAFHNGNFSARANPALFSFSQNDLIIDINYSESFFLLNEGKHQFLGISGRAIKQLYIGVNRALLDYGKIGVRDIEGEIVNTVSSREFLNTISVAYQILPNFSYGVNVNQLNIENYGIEGKSWYYDMGVAYQINYNLNKITNTVGIGVNLENFTSNKITLESPEFFLDIIGDGSEEISGGVIKPVFDIPKVLTVGISNELHLEEVFLKDSFIRLGLLTTVEYQEVLDSDLNHRTSIGQEVRFNDFFILRFGYYVQRNRPDWDTVNKHFHKEFTYGAGLKIPINRMTENRFPVTFGIDYSRLPQPFGSTEIDYEEKHFNSFSASLAFDF